MIFQNEKAGFMCSLPSHNAYSTFANTLWTQWSVYETAVHYIQMWDFTRTFFPKHDNSQWYRPIWISLCSMCHKSWTFSTTDL